MTTPLVCALLSALSASMLSLEHMDGRSRPADPIEFAARRSHAPPPTRPAKGRLLVAQRSVNDPRFAETVILLVGYSDQGAMGLIINRPTDVRLASALPKLKELRGRSDHVFVGGPVSPGAMLLLIRSDQAPEGAQLVFDDVYVSGKLETLRKALRKSGKTHRLRAYAGYAGWGPGQLDREIARGDWAIGLADASTIFDAPSGEMWQKLLDRFSVEWARKGGDPVVAGIKTESIRIGNRDCRTIPAGDFVFAGSLIAGRGGYIPAQPAGRCG
jgi:putative transcriptional regulator